MYVDDDTRARHMCGYYLISADIVWETVTLYLPPLVAALERWLAEEAGGEERPC